MIKENQRALNQINGLTDALILFPCMAFAYFIRFDLFHGIPGHVGLSYYMTTILCMAPLFWLMYGLMGLYDSFRSKNFLREFSLLLRSNVILFGVLLAFLFVCKQFHLSRWTLFIFFLLATVSVAVKRWMLRRVLRRFREHGYNLKHVLLVGCGEQAQAYCRAVQADRTLGFCIDHYLAPRDCLPGISYLGTYDAIANVLDRQNPDEVVIALEANEYTYLQGIIASSEKNGVKVSLIPFYNKFMPSRPAIDEIGGVSLVNLRHIPLDNIGNAFLKRAMDIIGSLILIICTSPLMLFAAVGVKLSSPGPILFKQERVGLNKKPFYMYKFRSMRAQDGSIHVSAKKDDDRITKVGHIIRKFRIDELPQLINVLKSDMSIVGPRPEMLENVEKYTDDLPEFRYRLRAKAGLTGLAQIYGKYNTSPRDKLIMDLAYIQQYSVWLDLKLILRTALVLLTPEESTEAFEDKKTEEKA